MKLFFIRCIYLMIDYSAGLFYSYLAKVVTESVHKLEEYINLCLQYGKPTTLIVLSSPVEHKLLFTESEKP